MKTILILTAGFGEGHNAAARNVAAAIHANSPDVTVEIADVFAEAYGKFNMLSVKGYHLLINRLPRVWQGVFELLHRTTFVPKQIWVFQAAARVLREKIATLKPDVIISTYPGNNFLLDYVSKKSVRRSFKTVTVVTDSITINSAWYQGHSDFLIVANDQTADIVQAAGVPQAKIKRLGFPVPLLFASPSAERPCGPPWRVLYTINSGRHLAPAIVENLLKVPEIELTVTVGRDEPLAALLRQLAQRTGREFAILGWVPNMPELMISHHLLIGKAGGATVQEALAAGTPMIITQIVPGQEEGNARLVIENQAGCLAETPIEIAAAATRAFANGAEQWQAWSDAASQLGTPSGAARTAQFLLQASDGAE